MNSEQMRHAIMCAMKANNLPVTGEVFFQSDFSD